MTQHQSEILILCLVALATTADGLASGGVRSLKATATELPPRLASWSPSSWQKYPIKQPPNYPDQVRKSFFEFMKIQLSVKFQVSTSSWYR
jgi:hypothetical protein